MAIAEDADENTRGGRVASIRKLLGMTGEAFAEYLNSVGEVLGFEPYWTGPKVTNTEKGRRDIQLPDLAILDAIDPANRGWFWIVFGRTRPRVTRPGASTLETEDHFTSVPRISTAKKRKPG